MMYCDKSLLEQIKGQATQIQTICPHLLSRKYAEGNMTEWKTQTSFLFFNTAIAQCWEGYF